MTTGSTLPGDAPSVAPAGGLSPPLVCALLDAGVVCGEDYDALPAAVRPPADADADAVLAALAGLKLLTDYQAEQVRAGRAAGLVLGNWRLLGPLGRGASAVVYRAEHVSLRRPAAVKVLASPDGGAVPRFAAEVRAVAGLHHPNLVAAFDAGVAPGPDGSRLHYLVMEYVPGPDLDALVARQGPLPVGRACELVHQVADALASAHAQGLVHRDVKPSNVLVAPDGRAKLLDFGLAQTPRGRAAGPAVVLGTLAFMAPEQAADPAGVDERADLYGLGATLYWCLTGCVPFPGQGPVPSEAARRAGLPPPSARAVRPEVPAALDAVLACLLAPRPADRYPAARPVMRALLPFLTDEPADVSFGPAAPPPPAPAPPPARAPRVLVASGDPGVRSLCRLVLRAEPWALADALGGRDALDRAAAEPFDVVLLDDPPPDVPVADALRGLRAGPADPLLKVVVLTADEGPVPDGADDALLKPFRPAALVRRVRMALRLKESQARGEGLARELAAANAEFERSLSARDGDLVRARNALVLGLAKLVEQRSTETGGHLLRLQHYCRALAAAAAATPAFADHVHPDFAALVEACAPLHDIGKVGLPDHILHKPGALDPGERRLMQAHTTLGAETLEAVARTQGFGRAFLQTAIDIARHHHERWDGTGYPDRLAGPDIPLAARLVAVADVYDALRSRRVYKPALSHHTAVLAMTEASPGHFDPRLLAVFADCAGEFDRVFREFSD